VNTVNDYSTATLVASVMATTYLYSASTSEYGETLYFWVTAVDIVGNESNPTSSVNESVPHVEPEDLAIEQRDWKSDISFKWENDYINCLNLVRRCESALEKKFRILIEYDKESSQVV